MITPRQIETPSAVIPMEVSSEVRWVGFALETAILPLLIRQKPDRHPESIR
jgi:hypothetical protein